MAALVQPALTLRVAMYLVPGRVCSPDRELSGGEGRDPVLLGGGIGEGGAKAELELVGVLDWWGAVLPGDAGGGCGLLGDVFLGVGYNADAE